MAPHIEAVREALAGIEARHQPMVCPKYCACGWASSDDNLSNWITGHSRHVLDALAAAVVRSWEAVSDKVEEAEMSSYPITTDDVYAAALAALKEDNG